MFFIYGASLVLWLMLLEVGAKKSWGPFNIGDPRELFSLFLRCAVAAFVVWIMTKIHTYKGTFDFHGALFAPFSAVFYYVVYILFGKKHRESWKEFLVVDRWNAAAMLGCLIMGFVSVILR